MTDEERAQAQRELEEMEPEQRQKLAWFMRNLSELANKAAGAIEVMDADAALTAMDEMEKVLREDLAFG